MVDAEPPPEYPYELSTQEGWPAVTDTERKPGPQFHPIAVGLPTAVRCVSPPSPSALSYPGYQGPATRGTNPQAPFGRDTGHRGAAVG